MSETQWEKKLVLFALPVLVLIFYLAAVGHFSYTPDDTYIYGRFARNLVHGNGIAFNPGEPVYGVTGPLWMLVIAGGGAIGVDYITAAKGMDLVLACLALLVFYFFAFEVIRDVAAALFASLSFSVNIWFLRWAGTGMETSLSVLLVLAVFWNCLRNQYLLASVLAALAALVRPEAALVFVLVVIDEFLNSVDKRTARRTAAGLAAAFALVLAPWLVYAYMTFGRVLPATAFAKADLGLSADALSETAFDIIKTVAVSDGLVLAVLVGAGLVLVRMVKKRMDADPAFIEARFFFFRQSFIGLAWIVLLPVLYIGTGVNVVSRYLLLVLPLVTIYAFFFLYHALKFSTRTTTVYTVLVLFTAAVMIQSRIVYRTSVVPGISAFQQGMEECLIPMGQWLKSNTPEDAVVYAPDIGAIGYFSERTICDAAGLVSPAMLDLIRKGYTQERMIDERAYVSHCTSDYVIHRSRGRGHLTAADLRPLFTKSITGISLSDPRTMYYTVYTVLRDSVHQHP